MAQLLGGSPRRESFDEVSTALASFLAANPLSSVSEEDLADGKCVCIKNPWGDPSLVLAVKAGELSDLAEALNNVILPERLSAIWHSDLRALEVIWTALPLSPSQEEINGRKFSYRWKETDFECEFGRSSDRLVAIGASMSPVMITNTYFRNLGSFHRYSEVVAHDEQDATDIKEPRSFWVRNVDWDEDQVLDLIKHLNFFLTYYDNRSPTVLVHNVDTEAVVDRFRYVAGSFPGTIQGRPLDENLLNFWGAAQAGDEIRRFTYYYRIIEYSSFYYLEAESRSAVRKLLATPHAGDDIPRLTDKLMAAMQNSKLDEYARFSAIIRDTLDIDVLWQEMSGNLEAFSTDITFDGGFTLKKLVAANGRKEDFEARAHENFTKSIRDIRNAVSHGRDQKTGAVITPTSKNLMLLRPWVHLIALAAGEVVLYKDAA